MGDGTTWAISREAEADGPPGVLSIRSPRPPLASAALALSPEQTPPDRPRIIGRQILIYLLHIL